MDKNREAFENYYRTVNLSARFGVDQEGNYTDELTYAAWFNFEEGIKQSESEQAKDYEQWIDERNNLLAVIAKKDAELERIACNGCNCDSWEYCRNDHVDAAKEALRISPDNCKLVPKAWMAMSGSFEMIASTKDKLPDSVADAAIQLFTISTINDTISGRGVE
jgi:7-cyano-7-deazaguanine synthase in queuosine biosynthesis